MTRRLPQGFQGSSMSCRGDLEAGDDQHVVGAAARSSSVAQDAGTGAGVTPGRNGSVALFRSWMGVVVRPGTRGGWSAGSTACSVGAAAGAGS